MGSIAEAQDANITPPRRGAVLAIDVDSTARAYNISALALGGYTPEADLDRRNEVFLYLQAETSDVFFYFHSATASDLDDTAKITAGGAVAFANTYGAVLEAGNPPLKLRIDRSLDKFLIVKAAVASGILRVWAASEAR